MRIVTSQHATHRVKPEGLEVDYYLFPEYEIHYNEQQPGSSQTWHHHEKIWETIYIVEGELTAKWKDHNEERQQVVRAGDVIESEHTPHSFTNHTQHVAKFLVIKQILSGKNMEEIFKNDKIVDA